MNMANKKDYYEGYHLHAGRSQPIDEGGVAKFLPFEPCKRKRPKASKGTIKSSTILTDHLGSRILISVANASSGDM